MNKMKPALRHVGAAVIGLAAVYGGYKVLEDITTKYGHKQAVITEYHPKEKQNIQPLSYEDFVKREPSLPISKDDLVFIADLNNDSNPDIIISKERESVEILEKQNDIYQVTYTKTLGRGNSRIKILGIKDLYNDGSLELIVNGFDCGASSCSGQTEIIQFKDGKYQITDKTDEYEMVHKTEDLDGDGIDELLTYQIAPGQESLPNASLKNWFIPYQFNGKHFEKTNTRILEDSQITDSSNPNPYNIQQKVTESETYSQRPSLENRIYSQPDIGYAQPHNQEEYQIVQRYLHGLNLVLKDSVNMLSAQENPLPYDPIVGANVNVSVRTRKNNETIIDEKYYSDSEGIVNLRFPPLQHYKNDSIDICFNIERLPYDPIMNACLDIEVLDPQLVRNQGSSFLSHPNLRRGDNIQGFYVEKGKSESGIGDLQDITLSLTMHMLDRYRYSDR